MSDPRDLQRLIGDVVRLGTIATVDHAKARVTVKTGELTTAAVPWLAGRAGGARIFSAPTVGEQVVLVCPEGDIEGAVALPGVYSDANPAPGNREKQHVLLYEDGATVTYDAAAHLLTAMLPAGGTVQLTAPGGVTITGDVTIDGLLHVTGKVTVDDDVVADGVSLDHHRHGQVKAGGDKTGEPA